MNKFLIATLIAMVVISFGMSSVSAVDDYKANIDGVWWSVITFTFTDIEDVRSTPPIKKQVAAGDDHTVKLPNTFVWHTVVIDIKYNYAGLDCNHYIVTLTNYNGKGIKLFANGAWVKEKKHKKLRTSLDYDYNGQSGTLHHTQPAIYLK